MFCDGFRDWAHSMGRCNIPFTITYANGKQVIAGAVIPNCISLQFGLLIAHCVVNHRQFHLLYHEDALDRHFVSLNGAQG